jgi:hypothetical protein
MKLSIFAAGASLAAYVAPGLAPAHGASPTAPTYRFTVVATIGAPAPGGGIFPFDFEPTGINDSGTVAFTADVSDASGADIGEGVFFDQGGKIIQVNRVGLPAPGATTFGIGEFGRLGFNSAGDIAVPFSLNGWNPNTNLNTPSGAWRYTAGTGSLTPVAVPGMAMPGGGTFEGMGANLGMNNKGQIVFPALVTGTQVDPGGPGTNGIALSLFLANRDGSVVPVVRPGEAAPGGKVFDDAWNGAIDNAGDIVFGGYVKGDPCLNIGNAYACGDSEYLRNGATGAITSIAHQGDPAPGGGTFAVAFGGVPNDAGKVVFIGDLSPSGVGQVQGVFAYANGSLSAVARPGDPMPGGSTFESTGDEAGLFGINNHGDIAFAASLNTDSTGTGYDDTGMYVQSHGSLNLVARTGTVIPGVGTIKALSQTPPPTAPATFTQPGYGSGGMINDSGQVLLNVTLTNGKGVMLVATPVH